MGRSLAMSGGHHHDQDHHGYQSQQTLIMGFVGNYLVWFSFGLMMWMSFFPIVGLRRMPARGLNWITRKLRMTENFRFTTVLVLLSTISFAVEYINQTGANKNYRECKLGGHSPDNCRDLMAKKLRAERNFWCVGFNFLCCLMVDRLSERLKVEENYNSFLEARGLTEAYARHETVLTRTVSAQDKTD